MFDAHQSNALVSGIWEFGNLCFLFGVCVFGVYLLLTSSLLLLKYWPTIRVAASRAMPTPIPVMMQLMCVQIGYIHDSHETFDQAIVEIKKTLTRP